MAKLYFRYGAMGAAKTLNLIAVEHNYRQKHRNVIVLRPTIECMSGPVRSRAGLETECVGWDLNRPKDSLHAKIDILWLGGYDCVLVDEAQFLTEVQVDVLREVATRGTPVICYGLRTDFRSHLFEGSRRLMEVADTIEEVKTVCAHCDRKATQNRRIVPGDDQVLVGGDESYEAVCWEHFRAKVIKE